MAIGSITNAHVTYSDNAPTVAVPSGAVSGDIFLMWVSYASDGNTVTWPTGFTEVSTYANNVTLPASLRAAIRVATGAESGSFVASTSGYQQWWASCAVITGTSSTVDDVESGSTYAYATSATLTGGSITTTGANRDIFWLTCTNSGGTTATATLTPPSGFTQNNLVDLGNGRAAALASGSQASAGSATYSGSMGFGGVADSRSGLTLTIALAQSGGGGITGSLSGTLSSLTGSAAATLPITGSLAVTLGAVTTASSGAVSIAGLVGGSLAPLTSSATGVLAIAGQSSPTLGSVVGSATAVLTLASAISATLDALTSTSAGALVIASLGGGALAPMTGASEAALSIAAQVAATLGDLTGSAEGVGVSIVVGSVSSTLDAITTTSAAQIQIQASTSGTLSPVTLASQATLAIAAQVAATLGGLTALCAATIADPASPAAPASNSRFIRNFAS